MELLVSLLVFAAALLGLVGIWQALTLRRRQVEARLEALGSAAAAGGSPEGDRARSGPPLLEGGPLAERLRLELWRAGLELRPVDFLALTLLAGLLVGGAALLFSPEPWLAAPGFAVGFVVPFGVLHHRQARRAAQFEAQLPDALSMITSSLRSGYSFLQSLQAVAEQAAPPMAREMRRVTEEVGMGMALDDALQRLVERVRSYDVELLVTAISIQHQVGGNLAELLDTIGETIRERFRTRAEIRALTAEGRLSGIILFLLPIVLLVLLALRSPDYMRPLFTDPVGQAMLAGAFLLQLVGGLAIRRLLTVDA